LARRARPLRSLSDVEKRKRIDPPRPFAAADVASQSRARS
jgi:hypothetical protein